MHKTFSHSQHIISQFFTLILTFNYIFIQITNFVTLYHDNNNCTITFPIPPQYLCWLFNIQLIQFISISIQLRYSSMFLEKFYCFTDYTVCNAFFQLKQKKKIQKVKLLGITSKILVRFSSRDLLFVWVCMCVCVGGELSRSILLLLHAFYLKILILYNVSN